MAQFAADHDKINVFIHRSLDFLPMAFSLFPDKEFCILTMPHMVPEFPLLQSFVVSRKQKTPWPNFIGLLLSTDYCLIIFCSAKLSMIPVTDMVHEKCYFGRSPDSGKHIFVVLSYYLCLSSSMKLCTVVFDCAIA